MAKKMGFWLLAAILMVNGFSWEVLAAGAQENIVSDISETWVNPVYEGVVGIESPAEEPGQQEGRAGSGNSDYVSLKEASDYMCSQLVERAGVITVRVQTNISNLSSLASTVFENAVAVSRKTSGWEGDYIVYHVGSYRVQVSYFAAGRYTLTYSVTYLSTRAQEQKVTARVKSILSSLGVERMTTYGKIRTIYNYICRNVSYD